ncbi:MAG: phospholipid carrier-dependent glycosyltransferase [Verrucomicrobiota bacterium]
MLIFWAAIFLPGLGSTEIKGEEGRRILPAVTMLEEGNWLVPYVGGKPFLRKPPLINWLIAASFKISGTRNEWSARMPSALAVLALALTIVASSNGRGWINAETGFMAAIFAMTQFGLLAKARFAGAEIEGVYAPLSGLAIVTWLAWWHQRRSPWLTWTIPFVFLGLAALAKGPSLHLLFFYAVVFATLWSKRQWRRLIHPAHFAGVAIATAIFAAWAIPFFHSPETLDAAAVWKRQGIDRFTESDFNAANFFLNIPRGLMDQLPWLLLTPLLIAQLRKTKESAPEPADPEAHLNTRFLRSLTFTIATCFFGLLLVPGVLPRYLLPLGTPFALLLALSLTRGAPNERALRIWHKVHLVLGTLLMAGALASPLIAGAAPGGRGVGDALRHLDFARAVPAALVASVAIGLCALVVARRPVALRPRELVMASGTLCAAASMLYAIAAVPWINRADNLRPLAAQIDAAIPPGKKLFVFDPGYAAVLFYLRHPFQYVIGSGSLPPGAEFVLAREQSRRKLPEDRTGLVVTHTFSSGKERERFLLLQPRERISNHPTP